MSNNSRPSRRCDGSGTDYRPGYNDRSALRRSCLSRRLGVAPLENRLKRVARLGDTGQIERRLRRRGRPRRTGTPAILEVLAHPVGLTGVDGTGVRLSGHADCFKRVQNRLALYFKFSCKIVNSNLRHPSLFAPLRRLAAHISLVVERIWCILYYP